MKVSFRGGVHPAHHSKRPTQHLPVEAFVSDTVRIIMSMHIGAPSTPCVKKGDLVKVGQIIAEAGGFVSAPVHASVSGKVTAVGPMLESNGGQATAITI